MKYVGLIISSLWRKPGRTLLTISSLFLAFLLFGFLQPIANVFAGLESGSGENRLIVSPKHSISDMLLLSQLQQLKQVPGVKEVSHQTWFGGEYQDAANAFPTYAVPPQEFTQIYSEISLPPEQAQAFRQVRTAAIVGRSTARRYALKVGDKLPILPTIWFNHDDAYWEFDIVGIYDGAEESTDTSAVFINFDYLDDYRTFCKGCISNFVLSLAESETPELVAAQVDALFANSSSETNTTTEQAWMLNFMRQLGNVGLIVKGILGAVFFTIVLLSANTMSQSIRERIPELAILKTLGFQGEALSILVLLESLIMTLTGAIPGMICARYALQGIANVSPQFASLSFTPAVFILGLIISFIIAIVVGMPPAVRAMRLNIVDALQS